MKKTILFVLLSLCITITNAQTDTIDKLKQLLKNEKQDTSRVLLLTKLAYEYLQSKPDTTLQLAQEGLSLARKIGFDKGEAEGLTKIGNAYNNLGNYSKALENLFQAKKVFENIHDQMGILKSLISISNNYQYQGDFRQALDYSFQAKFIAVEIKNENAIHRILFNIGLHYYNLKKIDSARIYIEQVNDMATGINDTILIGSTLVALGDIHKEMQQYRIALEYYRSGILYLNKADDDQHLIDALISLADLFDSTKQVDSCLFYSRLAFEKSQKAGLLRSTFDASKLLYITYKSKDLLDSAFKYLEIAFNTRDSLFTQDKTNKLQNLTINEKIRQQEIESEKEKVKEQRRLNIEYAGIAIGLIIFLSLFLLLSHSIIVNAKWIKLIGVIGLLLVFQFVSILISPYLAKLTNNSTVLMLLALVVIAALLVPIHNKLEKWIISKLVEKNKKIRLASAKRTLAELERDTDDISH